VSLIVYAGTTGGPLMLCDIKLVNWEEGNYTVNDYPNPRGEIHVGGDNVAAGYYKQPEKTKTDFYQENGKWWFRTGDIGEFTPKGALMVLHIYTLISLNNSFFNMGETIKIINDYCNNAC